MKKEQFSIVGVLFFTMMSASAQTYKDNPQPQPNNNTTSTIAQYILNWAAYLGYDLSSTTQPSVASTQLTDPSDTSVYESQLFNSFFGSIPTTTLPSSGSSSSTNNSVGLPFAPNAENTTVMNSQSNLTFKNYNGGSQQDNSQAVSINASSLVDQPPYQADPVTQALFNILGTPDVSYCLSDPNTPTQSGVLNGTNPNNTSGQGNQPCPIAPTLFRNQVVENAIGSLPTANSFYTIQYNANLIPQLNSNSLIAPLSYSNNPISSSSGSANQHGTPGLVGQNQADLAANFIRYVSGSVIPTVLPNYNVYQTLYSNATSSTASAGQVAQAQAILSSYLTNLRVYAAQSSVGMSNLYYILSRRLAQPGQGNNQTVPSQAFNEYQMATWRIPTQALSPSSGSGSGSSGGGSGSSGGSAGGGSGGSGSSPSNNSNQWISKINTASPATVEKEIAILLSEINYQLYLDRQIQERLLMTASVSLLQGVKATQPNSDLSNQITSATSTVPGGS